MKKSYAITIIVILVIIALFYYSVKKPGKYDEFAKCLSNKDAKMWGAYWCSHCAEQKRIFGKSFEFVKYIECGVPGDTSKQTEICSREGIRSYPTWEIDGERIEKVMEIGELSSLTGCKING